MLPLRALHLLYDPAKAWAVLKDLNLRTIQVVLTHAVPFALIPAVAGWYGTSLVGWRIGDGELVTLSKSSALDIAISYYFAMLAGVICVGWIIRWMSTTYGANPTSGTCMLLASLSATPLFLVGALQSYPVHWLNLLAGLPALGYTLVLFFIGVPIVMGIPAERAFLFSCAVMAFGLVTLVAMLAIPALLWGSGFAPVFAR